MAFPDGLHHQHTEGKAANDKRCGEERGVALLAGFREVAKVGVVLGAVQREWLTRVGDLPDEPFTAGQSHIADGTLLEPLGGSQHEAVRAGLAQVDRADVRVETLGDQVDDIAKRLVEIV
jgi:ribosomal protein S14